LSEPEPALTPSLPEFHSPSASPKIVKLPPIGQAGSVADADSGSRASVACIWRYTAAQQRQGARKIGPLYGVLFHPLRAGALIASSLLVGLAACVSTPLEAAEGESITELYDLLEEGSFDPEEAFDEDDFFAEMESKYATELTDDEGALLGVGDEEQDDEADLYDGEVAPYNPYVEFGSKIIVYPDGLIMKPFHFPKGFAKSIQGFISDYGDFPIYLQDPGKSQPLDSVRLDLREDWNTETWTDPRMPNVTSGTPVSLGDALFVTAVPELLAEVLDLIDVFSANATQIEIEARIVEVTRTDSLDIGFRPGREGLPIFGLPNHTFVRSADFSFPNSVSTAEALFSFSSVHSGLAFNAVLEAVAGLENVEIISRPKVAVREGARAEIINTTRVPYLQIKSLNTNGTFAAAISFLDVGVQMFVVPRVIGDDTIVLNIDIEASQETGSAVTFTSGSGDAQVQISSPKISTRKARTVVRLFEGQALVLGGLISERKIERETKIPILGDIPLIGHLFKSKLSSKEHTEVLFFIRPRILEGSDLNKPFE
jgi:hypothetical protein